MGWTHCFDGIRKPNGEIDRRRECDMLLTWCRKDENGNVISSGEVLKSAMVGSTYYAAVRNKDGKVWAAVFLTCGRTRHDGTAWGYKDMDESMGPCEDKCPVSILDLLTPTDSQWANEWRDRCRKNAATAADRSKEAKAVFHPFVPQGITVENRRGSWLIGYSSRYSARYRFAKRIWHDFDRAMVAFLMKYGTPAQKAEYAATGRECPAEWKEVA